MTVQEEIRCLMLEAHPRPNPGPYIDWEDVLGRAGARSRPRSWRRRRFGVLLAVAASAAALVLMGPFGGEKVGVLDRALAAVGSGQVVHAVVEYSWPQDVVVDLATGAERERVHRYEFWYDEQRQQLLHRSLTGGWVQIDHLISGAVGTRIDPVLAGFATRYREALASGEARVIGDTSVDGRPTKRIEFDPREGGAVEEVLVDAETYAPVSFQETYPGGRKSPVWRVATIESVSYDPSIFREASAKPRLAVGEEKEARSISLDEAARALGAAPLWLGPSFAGHPFVSAELSETTAWLTDGSKLDGVIVRLTYGPMTVSLARDAAGTYAVGFGEDDYPTPPEGSIAVTGNDPEGWQGELRHGDFAVVVSGPSKEEVVAAASALTPRR
jgi:hypothetical protein